jgi:hypothetical protein
MAHLNMAQVKQRIEEQIKAERKRRYFSRTTGHLMAPPPIELRHSQLMADYHLQMQVERPVVTPPDTGCIIVVPPRKKPPAPQKKAAADEDDEKKSKNMRFSNEELETLMDIVEECLPIGKILWKSVESRYNLIFPERPREVDNIRHQFSKHANKKVPTENPNIPVHVRGVKDIQKKILGKANCVRLGDDSEDEVLAEVASSANQVSTKKNLVKAEDTVNNSGAKTKHSKAADNKVDTASILQAHLIIEAAQREVQERCDRKGAQKERHREMQAGQQMSQVLNFISTAMITYFGDPGRVEWARKPQLAPEAATLMILPKGH